MVGFTAFATVLVVIVAVADDTVGRLAQELLRGRSEAIEQACNEIGVLVGSGVVDPETTAAVSQLVLLGGRVDVETATVAAVALMNNAALWCGLISEHGCDRASLFERATSVEPRATMIAQNYAYFREQSDFPLLAAEILSKATSSAMGPRIAAAALCAPHSRSKGELSERYARLLLRLDIVIAALHREDDSLAKASLRRDVDAAHLLAAMPIAWPYIGYAILPLHLRLAELFGLTTQSYRRQLPSHLSLKGKLNNEGSIAKPDNFAFVKNPSTQEHQTKSARLLVVAELGENTSPGILFEEVFVGLCRGFDVVFAVPPHLDTPFTVRARLLATETISLPTSSAREARDALFDARVDVILYLALGLSTLTYASAQSRLAPVQLVFGHGHPVSPGLPDTIDYFVSSTDFEVSGSEDEAVIRRRQAAHRKQDDGQSAVVDIRDDEQVETARRVDEAALFAASVDVDMSTLFQSGHQYHITNDQYEIGPRGDGAQAYAEQVVLFDSRTIGMVRPGQPARLSRADVFRYYWARDIDVTTQGAPLLTCLQHSKKLHPDFDDALAATLELAPEVRIVFLEGAKTHLPRWRRSIGTVVDRHFVFVNRSSRDAILALVTVADAALDTYPWGGGVTILEALALCTPVVVLPNHTAVLQLAMAHHKAAALDGMLLAKTPTEFGNIAARLANDPTFRIAARSRACARMNHIFDPQPAIDEWVAFIRRILVGRPPEPSMSR